MEDIMRSLITMLVAIILLTPLTAGGGENSLGIYAGGFFPTGDEAKWIDPSPNFGVLLIRGIKPRWDFKADLMFSPVFDGTETNQLQFTATAGWRYFLSPIKQRHPYVGFGVGLMRFSSEQKGSYPWYYSAQHYASYTGISVATDAGFTIPVWAGVDLDVNFKTLFNIPVKKEASNTLQFLFSSGVNFSL
ncbi:MAG: hypothetical protein ACE5OR_06485 [bacterium]